MIKKTFKLTFFLFFLGVFHNISHAGLLPGYYEVAPAEPQARLGVGEGNGVKMLGGGTGFMIYEDPKTCQNLQRTPRSAFLNGKDMNIKANDYISVLIEYNLRGSANAPKNNLFLITFWAKAKHNYKIKITSNKLSTDKYQTSLELIDLTNNKAIPLASRSFERKMGLITNSIRCTDKFNPASLKNYKINRVMYKIPFLI